MRKFFLFLLVVFLPSLAQPSWAEKALDDAEKAVSNVHDPLQKLKKAKADDNALSSKELAVAGY